MGCSMKMLGVVNLLLLVLWPCVSTQSCPAGPAPPELAHPDDWSIQMLQSDTQFMSSIVHSFLNSVQPNPFPKDLLVGLINQSKQFTDRDTTNEILRYEIGFLVCVAIGILYILLMPLIGLCFACCRCCGNCGGRMYQEQTKSISCRRRSFYWATFLITLLILAGNICMFLSNTYTQASVTSGPDKIINALQSLQSYVTTVPKQIDQVVNESFVTMDNITYRVNGIGNLLGKDIQNAIARPINPALDSVSVVAKEIQQTSLLLQQMDRIQSGLQTQLNLLQTNLTAVRDRINTTLKNSGCTDCLSDLNRMTLDTNLSFPSLSNFKTALDQAEKSDLNAQINKGKQFIESIPERLTNETKDSVQGVEQQLKDIKGQISQVASDLPINSLNSISSQLNVAHNYTKLYEDDAMKAEHLRWIIALILCCLVLLVVVCNLLGLLLGPVGHKSKDDPTDRSSTANCGGLFLMASVGFSFIFSWIFMIVVLILFIVGGNTYTLICVPWETKQLFQLIDTPGVIPGFQLSQSLGLKSNLTISQVYNDCQNNKSLWDTLHLEEIFNLNDFLNVSKYTGEVQQTFEKSRITIPNITLLDTNIQKQLNSFSSTASSVNISSIITKISACSEMNLTVTADKLDLLAKNQSNATIKAELQNEAKDLRSIQTWINITISPLVLQLNAVVTNLSIMTTEINDAVRNVLEKFSSAQDFLNNNTTQIAKSKLAEFVDCQIGVIDTFTKWANRTITKQVGRCGPVAAAVDTVEYILCKQLVDSLNAFWFSLGWCMAFFIPSIIFTVKLAKFYRRMNFKDEHESNMMMTPIPRVTIKPH